jgi:hypothetical protein
VKGQIRETKRKYDSLWRLSRDKEKSCEEGDAEAEQGSGGKKETCNESYATRPQEPRKSQSHPRAYQQQHEMEIMGHQSFCQSGDPMISTH